MSRMAIKRKHSEVTLKTKYESLKQLDKNRPNKEVAIQLNVLGRTPATWKKKARKKFIKLFKIHH